MAIEIEVEAQSLGVVAGGIDYGVSMLAADRLHSDLGILLRNRLKIHCVDLVCGQYLLFQIVFRHTLEARINLFLHADLVSKCLSDYLKVHCGIFGIGNLSKFLTTDKTKDDPSKVSRFLGRQVVFEAI